MFRHLMGKKPPVIPPPALNISMSKSGGSIINVTGASGALGIFSYSVTGGTGFYTVDTGNGNVAVNPSGKLGQLDNATPNAASGSFALTWADLAVGETQYAYFGCSVTDTGGTFDSATIPNLGVKRIS